MSTFDVGREVNVRDGRGTVVVQVTLRESNRPVKGNRTRSITVRDARVTEVAAAIEQVLRGKRKPSTRR